MRRHDTKVKLNSSFFTYYNTTAMVPSNQHSIDNQQSTATVAQHLLYPATNGKVLSATNNRQLTRQSTIETRSDGDLSLPKNCTVYAKSYGNRIKKVFHLESCARRMHRSSIQRDDVDFGCSDAATIASTIYPHEIASA